MEQLSGLVGDLSTKQAASVARRLAISADRKVSLRRTAAARGVVLYIWVAAIAAGFGIAIGAIQASHYLSCRRLCRTIIATADTSHIPPSAPVDIQSSRTC